MNHPTIDLRFRARLLLQRFWRPTCACMTAMPGSLGNLLSAAHWLIALRTGLLTAALAPAISFTPLHAMFVHRWGNAAIVGALTSLGDAWSHPNHYGFDHAEALLTGAIAFALALASWYLLEDGVRRVRALFSSQRADDSAGR